MGKESKIAEIGIINILNQMKNPLTNIRLCVEILECGKPQHDEKRCHDIIKKSAIDLEESIRDLLNSFSELGLTVHLEDDNTPLE